MRDLSRTQAQRLKRIEYANYRRALKAGVEAERVDFIAICEAQDWKCAITGEDLDPALKGPHPKSISLDHENGITNGGGHVEGNVRATLLEANHEKGNRVESKQGARIKRLQGLTGPRARRNRAKANGTYRPIPSRPDAWGKSQKIAGRGFDKQFKRTIPSKNNPSVTVRRDG